MVEKFKQNWIQLVWGIGSALVSFVIFIFAWGQVYGRSTNDIEQVKKDVVEIKISLSNINDKKVDKEVFEILLKSINDIKQDVREIRNNQK